MHPYLMYSEFNVKAAFIASKICYSIFNLETHRKLLDSFSSVQLSSIKFIISREKFICGIRNNYQIECDSIYHIHNIVIKPYYHVRQYF